MFPYGLSAVGLPGTAQDLITYNSYLAIDTHGVGVQVFGPGQSKYCRTEQVA